MRILFDHQVFSWQTYGGISRYVFEQLHGLRALGQETFLPENFFSENVYLRQSPDFQRNSMTPFAFKGKKWLQNRLGRQQSIAAIEALRPQIFHPTYFDPYFLKTLEKRGIPFVLTVHDMIHEIYGHGSRSIFSLDAHVIENKRLLAQKAAAVITVSENTCQDLLRFCPDLDPEKIHVIHHGNSLQPPNQPTPQSTNQPIHQPTNEPTHQPTNYLLFVGQRKAYKNFSWMLDGLSELLRSRKELKLLCIGGGEFDSVEKEQIEQLGVERQVQYHQIRTDAELAEVYSAAACFIFPSQYEGFGLPVLEAFACGCPVVLNRASSLPEVGGEAAGYFDVHEKGSLETAVRRMLEDTDFRKNKIAQGLERAKTFTWKQSVEKHLVVYQAVTNQTNQVV